MTNKIENIIISSIVATVVMFGVFFVSRLNVPKTFGSSPEGVTAIVASSSTITVGPQQTKTVFASTPSCAARIVTTTTLPVTFSMTPTLVPSSAQGHVQATSTTVTYGSGTSGCDAWAYWAIASTTITITETR